MKLGNNCKKPIEILILSCYNISINKIYKLAGVIGMLAKDIMTKDVAVVQAETTIDEVSRIFVDKNISGLPVVNQYHKLIGIVSEGDLVYKQKPVRAPMFINLFDGLIPLDRNAFHDDMKRIAAYQVKDIMSSPAIYAYADTPVSEIAEIIINKKINRIPIVNEIMEVIGIVSRHDIVRSMVMEADAEDELDDTLEDLDSLE